MVQVDSEKTGKVDRKWRTTYTVLGDQVRKAQKLPKDNHKQVKQNTMPPPQTFYIVDNAGE